MKKFLLAMLVLAYAVLFVNTNPDAVSEVKAEKITITENVEIQAANVDLSAYGVAYPSPILGITWDEAYRVLQENGSGVFFFGKTDSKESVVIAPILNEIADELGIHIYYIDANSSVTTEVYTGLSALIQETFVLDDAGNKSFFLPNVIAVKNGVIMDYQVSLPSGMGIELTDDQRTALKNRYIEVVRSAKD